MSWSGMCTVCLWLDFACVCVWLDFACVCVCGGDGMCVCVCGYMWWDGVLCVVGMMDVVTGVKGVCDGRR